MNTAMSCLYSRVITSSPDDQRSTLPNICDLQSSRSIYSPVSIRCREPHSATNSSCGTRHKRGSLSVTEHRTALYRTRSRMAATALTTSRSVKTSDSAQVLRSKTQPQSLAMPCPANVVRACVAGTKYSVVSLVTEELGMEVTNEDTTDCDLYWIDCTVPLEKYLELRHYQRLNHFPGMGEISRKDSLARNTQKMKKLHSEEYSYVPSTWVLPGEYNALSYFIRDLKRRRKSKTFIIKPHNSSMGNGIYLARSIEDIPKDENVVVQEYVDKPFLLDGFKLDLRVYVLVTACNPLRIFVYKDGLVRLSTQTYTAPTDENLGQQFMHLTNYSINKHSSTFDSSERSDSGSKRTVKYFNSWLAQNGYSVSELWARIYDLIIKTLITAHPYLVHSYQVCRPGSGSSDCCQFFEILGFDILLDESLKPWLLEVNRSPSFGTDSQLDLDIKSGVIRDALKIINIRPTDRKREKTIQKMASKRRLLHTSSSRRTRYNFLAEQEDAIHNIEVKKQQVKARLDQIRKERELEDHEEDSMGDYVRIYPSTDWTKAKVYDTLIKSANKVSLVARSKGSGTQAWLKDKEEHELLELLSQYEDEDGSSTGSSFGRCVPSSVSCPMFRPSTRGVVYQPLSIQESSSPMDAVYAVMAARVAEEEQTQRTMIALNEMKPSYPGKQPEEVKKALDDINGDFKHHQPNMASFWLVSLDSVKRKQLLNPVRDSVKGLLHCYWRTANLDSIRLYQIFNRLFAFLLSKGGQIMWSAIVPLGKSTWEASFREKSDVISTAEMVCCRRIVDLCRDMVTTGYHYHHLNCPPQHAKQRRPSSHLSSGHSPYTTTTRISKSSSLPSIKHTLTGSTKQASSSSFPTSSLAAASPYKTPTSLTRRKSTSKPSYSWTTK